MHSDKINNREAVSSAILLHSFFFFFCTNTSLISFYWNVELNAIGTRLLLKGFQLLNKDNAKANNKTPMIPSAYDNARR